ncbi:L,D-transpeptidase [Sphingomonas sp. PAMC 26621]|uniref:L,D-transpeptidase n=1 Tax=Sphingomonas sp. PAMC 26621 TaxID=1112213 RepID=UPI000288E4DA|nr:L,D-transpeptidase [Sphingomonas sp. PAMC 26621]
MRAAGLILLLVVASPAVAQGAAPVPRASPAPAAEPTPAARRLAAWATRSQDTRGRPFLVIDKVAARVFAYDADGTLRATTPALLGAARGDVTPPDIGKRTLAQIGPADRITQAGRFEAHIGPDLHEDVLWIDYDSGLSLHRVVTGSRTEHRLTRLATPSTADNRVSFGCINVPRIFYETVVAPMFRPADGVVYILPEQRALSEVFPALPVALAAQR